MKSLILLLDITIIGIELTKDISLLLMNCSLGFMEGFTMLDMKYLIKPLMVEKFVLM